MSEISKSDINDFINQFPKNEIIETLNSIDAKISSLHTISSKDFLYFNTLLKKYYAKTKEISETNNSISIFFSNSLPTLIETIKEKNQALKKFIDKSNGHNLKFIEFLSLIYGSFDMLVVPFNNYKQNLMTFKYLLANLKLHLGYVDFSNKNELKASVATLENLVEFIYEKIDHINLKKNGLATEILNLKDYAVAIQDKNDQEIIDKLKVVSNKIMKLSIDEFWPSNITIDLTRRTQNCFSNMGEVITNIQFHDIIRQKMEHIQSSQKTLIEGLNELDNSSDEKAIESQIDFIVKIPEITDIQVAQLLYTNKDYQTSIEKITNKLISVGHEMKEINEIYHSISSNINKFEDSFISQLTSSQNSFNNFAQSINANCSNLSSKFKDIYKNYETLKADYNDIFTNEKSLRKEIKNFEQLIEVNGKNFGKDLIKRLIQLLTDLQLNSNSLKTNLNNITSNYRLLNNEIESFSCDDTIFQISTDILNNLNDDTQKTKTICKDFTSISLKISEEIAESIKKIEYYTFFKNTVEDIVGLLNQINDKVNYDNLKSLIGDNKEFLKKIEQFYTMKSERDIHEMMTESGKGIEEILETENNDIDDMDIELF